MFPTTVHQELEENFVTKRNVFSMKRTKQRKTRILPEKKYIMCKKFRWEKIPVEKTFGGKIFGDLLHNFGENFGEITTNFGENFSIKICLHYDIFYRQHTLESHHLAPWPYRVNNMFILHYFWLFWSLYYNICECWIIYIVAISKN